MNWFQPPRIRTTRANRALHRRTRRARKRWNRYLDAVGKERGALALLVLRGDATPVQFNRLENITRTLDRLEWAGHTWALYTWEWTTFRGVQEVVQAMLENAAGAGFQLAVLDGGRTMTRAPRVHYRGPLACKRFGVTTEHQSEVTCLHCRQRIQAWWAGRTTPRATSAELKALVKGRLT